MKKLFTLMLCLAGLQVSTMGFPAPEEAVSFNYSSDSREWKIEAMGQQQNGSLMEMILEGDKIETWKELVQQQNVYLKASVRQFVDKWKAGMLQAAPDIKIEEKTNKDGSVTVTYETKNADETGIRRFIRGKDGIYMLAYQVRPKNRDEKNYQIWMGIINEAKLVPNPAKSME